MLCIIVTALVLSFAGIHNQSLKQAALEEKLDAQTLKFSDVDKKRSEVRDDFYDVRDKAMIEAFNVTGAGISTDTKTIEKALKPAYSWTSNQEYDAARATLAKTLPEDSAYLNYILIDRSKYNADGSDFDLDEQGLKCYCKSIDIYPYAMDGAYRVYQVRVDFISYKNEAIQKKDHLTVDRQILTVTVSDKHEITNIEMEECDSIVRYYTVK
jgi:hypothetical protein